MYGYPRILWDIGVPLQQETSSPCILLTYLYPVPISWLCCAQWRIFTYPVNRRNYRNKTCSIPTASWLPSSELFLCSPSWIHRHSCNSPTPCEYCLSTLSCPPCLWRSSWWGSLEDYYRISSGDYIVYLFVVSLLSASMRDLSLLRIKWSGVSSSWAKKSQSPIQSLNELQF